MTIPKMRAWDTVMRQMVPVYVRPFTPAADVIVLRYIGQTDSLGDELCEGDIVEGKFDGSEGTVFVIEYLDAAFQFINIYDSMDGHFWSESLQDPIKIGNIYENSELREEL